MNIPALDLELADAHRRLSEASKAIRHWQAKAQNERDRISFIRSEKKRELRLLERVTKRLAAP